MEDAGLALLSERLVASAAAMGVSLSIHRPNPDGFRATLGRSRAGEVVLMRLPREWEGSRTDLTRFDLPADAISLDDETKERVAALTTRLAMVEAHAAMLRAKGLSPMDVDAASFRMNGVAASLLSGLGHSLRETLDGAGWTPSPEGWTTSLEHPAFVEPARVHRHLHLVRLDDSAIILPGGRSLMIRDREPGPEQDIADIEIGFGTVPDTALAAMTGRRLSELVELPGDAGRHARIIEAGTGADGTILVSARCATTAIP